MDSKARVPAPLLSRPAGEGWGIEKRLLFEDNRVLHRKTMSYRNSIVRAAGAVLFLSVVALVPLRAAALSRSLTFQNLTSKHGLSSDMILAVAVQGDKVWFGTYAGGATLYDPVHKTFKAYTTKGEPQDKKDNGSSINWQNLLAYNHVTAIEPDGDQVWFGTNFYGFGGGGISCYRPRSQVVWKRYSTFDRRAKKVITLAVEPAGVWVGTERGLSFLDRKSGQWAKFYSIQNGLAGNFVNAIVNEPDELWAGTNAGVSRLDKTRQTWKSYAYKEGLEDLDIKALLRVGDRLWAGTSRGMLFSYDRLQDRWVPIAVPGNLPKGTVNSLAEAGGRVYVCRDDGVDVKERDSGLWDGLTTADGLPSNTVLCAAPAPEGVWFGTDAGASFLRLSPKK
jgi:ligand-binding sensor domain-containing protein